MWFKTVIDKGWPCKKAAKIEIQDPSNELEVLDRLRLRVAAVNARVDLVPTGRRVDVVVRDRVSDAVLCHLVPC
ncbi:MAG: hypothetical protein KJ558_10155 [Gammaproteobacteria bacterium]|nr:hypothetical protein [Gammaproteobacteria bacterium]MBU1655169.1 hypothetical protein [Gammaproteobacteria bacterium]MBU1959980.1 hypothetical protein [Gammaproteobacteria bacterium]